MGFGGKVTLIGCKIGALNRLPASFFVSVAYDCWAFRRLGVMLDASTGAIKSWLYRDPAHPIIPMLDQAGFARTGRESRAAVAADRGRRFDRSRSATSCSSRAGCSPGRDAVHSHLMKHDPPVDLRGSVLYHCGPVVVKEGDRWRVTAAGPTTSIREEPYQGEIIKRYGVRAVIGKGGMGAKTLAALKEHGAVYLNAIGGAAQFYARTITARGRRVAARVRHAGSDVAPHGRGFPRDRHDGRARQQPAQGHRAGIRRSTSSDGRQTAVSARR